MFLKIILILWILQLIIRDAICSVVLDSLSQKGIVVSEYCPKMEFCEEGTHVMCMYYDPSRTMGPRCTNPKNVSMTSELAIKLLEVSNAIRSKLAMGIEKGKGGVDLPRAYGMFKLHWDNELATFAQVLANQCVLRHDMCRATKRFPDPGQTAGLIRFSSPDWIPITKSKGGHITEPGLSASKVTYAITQALKTWYGQKSAVTPAMIIDHPDWTLNPHKQSGRLYLEMIHGPATHMGCGMSAYSEYAYYEARSPLNYNSMQVICNFSSRPKKHKQVYDLEPGPYTSRCGCPVNAVEDENCLCTYMEEDIVEKEEMNCDGVNCEQPVILLPIFTVEDAPPSKLIGRQGINRGIDAVHLHRPKLSGAAGSLEFNDDDYHYLVNKSRHEDMIVNVLNGITDDNKIKIAQQLLHGPNRNILKKSSASFKQSQSHSKVRKPSIFSRSVLITKANNPIKLTMKDFKKDVSPRKDFSKAKHLVDNYMESIKNYSNLAYRQHILEPTDRKAKRFSSGTETLNIEDNVLFDHNDDSFLHNENDTFHTTQIEIDHEGDRDTKLMTLLDKLEEEVQHIELTGNKKELFDAKIRKIYDSVLGKSSGLASHKTKLFADSKPLANGKTIKLIDLEHNYDHDLDHNHDHDQEHDHYLIHDHNQNSKYNKEKGQNHINDKHKDNNIGKTIDGIIDLNHNDNDEHHNDVDTDNEGKNSRMRIKARINAQINPEIGNEDSDYELGLREKPKKISETDKLLSVYGDPDIEYKPQRFYEHRKPYKNRYQDLSHEDLKMNRYNMDDDGKGKRFTYKHRDYYKNRDIASIESVNKHHYRRHKSRNDERNIDDVLSPERRKYYQERLENLERKLLNTRKRKFRNEEERHRRPVRPQSNDDEALRRPSKNHLEHFDMRERSRFLHGF